MAWRKKQRKIRKKIRPYDSLRRSKAAKLGWKRRRAADPSLAATHRKSVARKSARNREIKRDLAFQGIDLEKRWEGKGRDGSATGYFYERYRLEILDAGTVENIIDHVIANHPGEAFFVGGQVDFRDGNENLFTNNATMTTDTDPEAAQKIIDGLQHTTQNNSNPFQTGRSRKVDVEGLFVLVRFARLKYVPKSKRTRIRKVTARKSKRLRRKKR